MSEPPTHCVARHEVPIGHCVHPEGCASERAQRANHRHSAVLGTQCRSVTACIPKGAPVSERGRHVAEPSAVERRVAAIESLLVEKGLLTSDVVDAVVETYERDVGPLNGAKVVARAWVDPYYRDRLLADGTAAIGELGFGGAEGEHVVVLENTPAVHNVVVCTLCSCYPWPVLGLPPRWYKSFAYRARLVRERGERAISNVHRPARSADRSLRASRRVHQ